MSASAEYESFYNAVAYLVASETSPSLACEVLLVANLATYVATHIGGPVMNISSPMPAASEKFKASPWLPRWSLKLSILPWPPPMRIGRCGLAPILTIPRDGGAQLTIRTVK